MRILIRSLLLSALIVLLVLFAAAVYLAPHLLLARFAGGGNDSWGHYVSGGLFACDSPSFSEDGTEIVYASPATGHGDIYLTNLQSGHTRRITTTDDCELAAYFVTGRQIVFTREKESQRHVWTLDLDQGVERQLTFGEVEDDIADVSPTGEHLIVRRITAARTAEVCIVNVAQGDCTMLEGWKIARYAGEGKSLLVTRWDEKQCGTAHHTLAGEFVSDVAPGLAWDLCDASELALVAANGWAADTPDRDTLAVDLTTNLATPIGPGSRHCAFANGKVLFFVGYQCEGKIWQQATSKSHAIEAPDGYKLRPNRSRDGKSAVLMVLPAETFSTSHDFDIYLFDSETEQFTRVKPLLAK